LIGREFKWPSRERILIPDIRHGETGELDLAPATRPKVTRHDAVIVGIRTE
jgi:hypothetical protein